MKKSNLEIIVQTQKTIDEFTISTFKEIRNFSVNILNELEEKDYIKRTIQY